MRLAGQSQVALGSTLNRVHLHKQNAPYSINPRRKERYQGLQCNELDYRYLTIHGYLVVVIEQDLAS